MPLGRGTSWDPGETECSNRFDILKDDQFPEITMKKRKRNGQRNSTSNPVNYNKIPKTDPTIKNYPKFLVVTRNDGVNSDMSNVSPFLIKKAIDHTAGNNVEIKKLRNGTLLLKTENGSQAEKLLKLTKFFDQINVSIKLHNTLNTSKGVVYCPDLAYVSDDEILENLKPQNVIELFRFKRRVNGELQNTASFVLTFNSPILPNDIKAGYILLRVSPYIPQPMRCYQCQKFGHITKTCKSIALCGVCSEIVSDIHTTKDCKKNAKCLNCNDNHQSFSKLCPVYITEFEIQKIKITKNKSYFEAKKEYNETSDVPPPFRFSNVLKKYVKPAIKPIENKFLDIVTKEKNTVIEINQKENTNKTNLNNKDINTNITQKQTLNTNTHTTNNTKIDNNIKNNKTTDNDDYNLNKYKTNSKIEILTENNTNNTDSCNNATNTIPVNIEDTIEFNDKDISL